MARPYDLKDNTIRRCSRCTIVKPLKEFTKNKGLPLDHSYCCKPCSLEYRKWGRIKRRFGLNKEQYQTLVERQNDVCALCGQKERIKRSQHHFGPNYLAVDHDHKTGKVRGLLCNQCNIGLGNFKENIQVLRKAAEYLEGHQNGFND
jgi:hypothetical protein